MHRSVSSRKRRRSCRCPKWPGYGHAVCHRQHGNRPAHRIHTDVTPTHVGQILGCCAGLQARHALQPGIGAQAMQAQQQARLQHVAPQGFIRSRTLQGVSEVQPQVGFLDHIEQAGHRPNGIEFGFERGQVGRRGLRIEWRQRDPAAALGTDTNIRVLFQPGEGAQRFAHLGLQVGDKAIRVKREIQRLVVVVAVLVKVGRQVIVGLAIAVRADHPDFLAAQPLAQRLHAAIS